MESVAAAGPVKSAQAVLLEAAGAVADALLVSPSLLRGDGQIVVRLKPEVLDGATVRIEVVGRAMKVDFMSAVPETAALIEECAPRLVERLRSRMPIFEYAVAVERTGAASGPSAPAVTAADLPRAAVGPAVEIPAAAVQAAGTVQAAGAPAVWPAARRARRYERI